MIPNPIHKVLSTLSSHEVRHLLMGGQACVFYGAAEFSRDCDIVIVADDENLARLDMPHSRNSRPSASPFRHSIGSIWSADMRFTFAVSIPMHRTFGSM